MNCLATAEQFKPMSLDRVGRWSIEKLDMLTEYASAYSVVMNAQKRSWLKAYYYFDAFAGPGIALNKADVQVSEFLQGSPLRVLNIQPRFDFCRFIDKNPRRANLLRQTLARADPARYAITTGEANRNIQALVSGLGVQERALVFLDPYGLQVEWRTVELIAASNKVDLLINFSLMGVIRNLRRVGGPSASFRNYVMKVMKSTEWIDELYTPQGSLLGDPVNVRGQLAPDLVAERYEDDLTEIFAAVSEPAIMTNSRGGTHLCSHLREPERNRSKEHNELRGGQVAPKQAPVDNPFVCCPLTPTTQIRRGP